MTAHGVARWLLALLCASTLFACQPSGTTQIEVTIDSDLTVPTELDRVVMDVLGVKTLTAEADLTEEGLPRTIGLYHGAGPLGPFAVRVSGFKGTTLVIEKTVETSFVEGKTTKLLILLERACKDLRCADGQTCDEGTCHDVRPDEDGGVLPQPADDGGVIDPDAGTETTADGGMPSVCAEGYVGSDAAHCHDLDECKAGKATCDILTECVNRAGSFDCTACPVGYTGDPKVGCQSVDECAAGTDRCDPESPCTDTPTGYVCGDCPMGYTGDGKDGCVDIDECALGACDTLTSCANTSGGFTCAACPEGYAGTGETSCEDIDECADGSDTCDPLTACVNRAGDYECTACPAGYRGDGRSGCNNIDECVESIATCGSLPCVDTEGGYECGDCSAGYNGTEQGECVDIDECASASACDPLTTCQNKPGTFVCSACPHGYTGNGKTSCEDIDECGNGTHTCDPLTQCVNDDGSYHCTKCPAGYTGDGLSGCTNVDECSAKTDHCDALSSCQDTPGSYVCGDCPAGYSGDGTNGCTDIDECATGTPCDALTTCDNTTGSFTCSACPAGYDGNGKTSCEDIDECATGASACDPLTQCVNDVGAYHCTGCPSGYSGDGLSGCVPLPRLSMGDAMVSEGNSGDKALSFALTLSAAATQAVSVNYATADGTASSSGTANTGGLDYAVQTGSIVFAPGETTKTVSVTIHGDALNEANETLLVNLSSPTNALIADGQAVGTISNDDAAPTVSIGDVSAKEGDSGSTVFSFQVTLSSASGQTVSINYATANGTAVTTGTAPTGGADYVAQASVLSFAAGETTKTVSVAVNGDTLGESDETFAVNLSTPVNATLGDGQGTGKIENDDVMPALSVGDVSTSEGASGTKSLSFTVTLSLATVAPVTFNYATADGTASSSGVSGTGGADYVAQSGTLIFSPGETQKTVNVPINGDEVYESDETVLLNVSNVVNAVAVDSQGVGTIQNDELAPIVSISDVAEFEGDNSHQSFLFTVTLSVPSAASVKVNYTTANGTADSMDYTGVNSAKTITFSPGDTNQTISIDVRGDHSKEGDDTFFVNLANPTNATLGDSQGIGTIRNDD